VDKLTNECDTYARRFNARFREVGDLRKFSHLTPLKLLAIDYNEDSLNEFEIECNRIFGSALHITKSMPEYLEFLHPEATKAAGIDAVARHLGISSEEVMAIGDSWNDLEMLEYAGIAVVMGNAREAIKDKADYVTRSNEDHGVAEALEKLL
jgi:Cof subfamily protein (haloacid dehalogenase superfamily)